MFYSHLLHHYTLTENLGQCHLPSHLFIDAGFAGFMLSTTYRTTYRLTEDLPNIAYPATWISMWCLCCHHLLNHKTPLPPTETYIWDLYLYHTPRYFTSLSPIQIAIYRCRIYIAVTYLITLHQYHLPWQLYIDVGFILLSPTYPFYITITYPAIHISMWNFTVITSLVILHQYHLPSHLYINVGFILLSPTLTTLHITYSGTYISMWGLYSYRLLNHITPSPTHPPVYGSGVYITATYVTTYI
jgi:hypothetical protein